MCILCRIVLVFLNYNKVKYEINNNIYITAYILIINVEVLKML